MSVREAEDATADVDKFYLELLMNAVNGGQSTDQTQAHTCMHACMSVCVSCLV